ncbi:MAG: N-acetyltransferase [Actinobacteria bacterium]|mgnify:CR=1 FL=1|nr:MAG: N-acetyltransferase [Actinomycetota bacterium]
MSEATVKVHELALVESDEVGDGTVVWAYAHIMKGAVLGRNCKVGDHAFIESGAILGDRVTVKNNALIWHGVHIGDDVFVGPNVVFTNDLFPRAHQPSTPSDWVETHVETGVSIGANSTIRCGISIGANAMIGAGSVVVRDVRAHELVVGNPARQIGWSCYCGARLDTELACPACDRRYEPHPGGLRELDNA